MLVNIETYNDANSYYKDTFVKIRETGDQLWQISHIDSQRIFVIDTKGEQAYLDLHEGYNLDFAIPKRVTYQLGGNAVHLARIPARMWKKGIHPKNTMFTVLSDPGMWHTAQFNAAMIEGFINKPCYYSFEQAQSEFNANANYASCALNPRMSITRSGRLFLDQTHIATYEQDQMVVKKIFIPEITKLIEGLSIKVKGA